jgi:hypothetical protein
MSDLMNASDPFVFIDRGGVLGAGRCGKPGGDDLALGN